MPNINDALVEKETTGVVETKVVDQPVVETPTTEVTAPVVETEVAKTAETVVEKVKKMKKAKKVKEENAKEPEFSRPPLEQLTDDYETMLNDCEISGHKLIKLGYRCGKNIYGLKANTFGGKGKDFRCIAYKARKKSKSVDGKSRGIFYFGISQQKAKELCKEHAEIKISTFGKCSVQSQTPVELILDRATFTEKFGKDQTKVLKLLKVLTKATCESKKEQLDLAIAAIKTSDAAANAKQKPEAKKMKKK